MYENQYLFHVTQYVFKFVIDQVILPSKIFVNLTRRLSFLTRSQVAEWFSQQTFLPSASTTAALDNLIDNKFQKTPISIY